MKLFLIFLISSCILSVSISTETTIDTISLVENCFFEESQEIESFLSTRDDLNDVIQSISFIDFCVWDENYFGTRNKDKCMGEWKARPGYGVLAEEHKEKLYCRMLNHWANIKDDEQEEHLWLLKRDNDKVGYYTPNDLNSWSEFFGSQISHFLRVPNTRVIYMFISTTAKEMSEFMQAYRSNFEFAMILPPELKISPQLVAHYQLFEHHHIQGKNKALTVHLITSKRFNTEAVVEKIKNSIEGKFDGVMIKTWSDLEITIENVLPKDIWKISERIAFIGEIFHIDLKEEPSSSNIDAHWIVQSGVENYSPLWDHGLDGNGSVAGVADSGLDYLSCFFYDSSVSISFSSNQYENSAHRKVVQYIAFADATEGSSGGHGTHVVGSILGNSDATYTSYNGVAYNAKVAFYDVGVVGQAYLTVPSSLSTNMFPYAKNMGARVHSNSWGSSTNSYTSNAYSVDLYSYQNQDFLILFAAGNDGYSSSTVGTPATAKNLVAVGAAENQGRWSSGQTVAGLAYFSSRGPTYDDRYKPDVCAPGYSVTSAKSAASSTADQCSIVSMSGTSMATPVTAGLSILVGQYFTDGFYPMGFKNSSYGFVPMGALVKAVLINSARRMTGTEAYRQASSFPNYDQGFGIVDADRTLYFYDTSYHSLYVSGDFGSSCDTCESFSSSGQSTSYKVYITNASLSLKVTLVWHDYPGTVYNSYALVNDLDLTVSDGSSVYYPNNLDTADSLNNVEQVLMSSPTADTTYTITVTATTITSGPQPYAIVITGGFRKDSTLFPDYAPIISSGYFASTQLLIQGNNLLNVTGISVDIYCDSSSGVSLSNTVKYSSSFNVIIDISDDISTTCSTESIGYIELVVNGFYGKYSTTITIADDSIALKCTSIEDSMACSSLSDCFWSSQSECSISSSASSRIYTTSSGGDGGLNVGIIAGVVAALVIFFIAGCIIAWKKNLFKRCKNSDPPILARSVTPAKPTAELTAVATAIRREQHQPPQAQAQPFQQFMSAPTKPAPPPASKPIRSSLAPGWEVVVDPNSGDVYYWNKYTNETTWEKPTNSQMI